MEGDEVRRSSSPGSHFPPCHEGEGRGPGGWVRCHLGFVPQAPSWAPGSRERANPRSKQQRACFGEVVLCREEIIRAARFGLGLKPVKVRPAVLSAGTPPRDPLPRRSGRGGLETGTERSCLPGNSRRACHSRKTGRGGKGQELGAGDAWKVSHQSVVKFR